MTSNMQRADAAISWPGYVEFQDMMFRRATGTDTGTNTMTVCDAPPEDIRYLLSLIEENPYHCLLLFYDARTRQGIFRIPSRAHNAAKTQFMMQLHEVIDKSVLRHLVREMGSPLMCSADRTMFAGPDSSFISTHRLHHERWRPFPSVMVEVGEMQPFLSLMQVMQGWFRMSGGKVKIVVIIDICRRDSGRHEICFQKWRCPPLAGGVPGIPVCDTHVTVTLREKYVWQAGPLQLQAADFDVKVAPHSQPLPMVLEFDLLCDRAPGPGGRGF